MKIDKQEFEQMREKYSREVGSGLPGNKGQEEIKNQTRWIFFDRESLERILAQADTDPKKGGIKFHLTEYTQEVAEKYHPETSDSYVGRIALVFEAADRDNLQQAPGNDLENIGTFCPPFCE
jgi:hypothetical protein